MGSSGWTNWTDFENWPELTPKLAVVLVVVSPEKRLEHIIGLMLPMT